MRDHLDVAKVKVNKNTYTLLQLVVELIITWVIEALRNTVAKDAEFELRIPGNYIKVFFCVFYKELLSTEKSWMKSVFELNPLKNKTPVGLLIRFYLFFFEIN